MEKILERYERYSYAERQLTAPDPDSHASWTLEHAKLKARLEILQKNQSSGSAAAASALINCHREPGRTNMHYMGEDLDTLSLKELQNLEHQLDGALKHIRSKKNQLMYESISELQKKDKALQEHNNTLSKKVKEKEKAIAEQAQWEQQNQELNNSSAFFSSQVMPPPLNI
ncbi:hypothetical protein KSS87_019771, partial [Heliosperma pusillum]